MLLLQDYTMNIYAYRKHLAIVFIKRFKKILER